MRNGSGNPVFWQTPSDIGITINSTGSDDITDGSDETAIRLSIRAWNDIVRHDAAPDRGHDAVAAGAHGLDVDTVHTVLSTSRTRRVYSDPGTVAITLVSSFSNGRIDDADILFERPGVRVHDQVPGPGGAFNVGNVVAHELGHFVGLDHSGGPGATMYPYVDPP